MSRECQGKGNYWRGRRWGVLCTHWNGAAQVQVHNSRVQGGGSFSKRERQEVRGSGNIRSATLHIRSRGEGGLEVALRSLRQVNVDMGILQETKLMDGINTGQVEEYFIWGTKVESRHRVE